jgi:hypothetical protein
MKAAFQNLNISTSLSSPRVLPSVIVHTYTNICEDSPLPKVELMDFPSVAMIPVVVVVVVYFP